MTPEAGQVAVIPGAASWVTWGICKITGSHCGHVIISTGDGYCISADGDWGVAKVQRRPLTDFPNAVWSEFEFLPGQGQAAADYATAQVGKPYAYLDDALIGIERIFRFRFPAWVREGFQDDGQWQCAQLADAALYEANVHVFHDGRMIGDVFPGSFELEFIQRGWYTAEFFASFPIRWSLQAPADKTAA